MHSHKKVLSIGFTWVKWVLAFFKTLFDQNLFHIVWFFVIRYFMDLYPIQKIKAGNLNPTYWHPMLNDDLSSAIWFSQLRDKGSLFNTYIKGHSRVKISNVFFLKGLVECWHVQSTVGYLSTSEEFLSFAKFWS